MNNPSNNLADYSKAALIRFIQQEIPYALNNQRTLRALARCEWEVETERNLAEMERLRKQMEKCDLPKDYQTWKSLNDKWDQVQKNLNALLAQSRAESDARLKKVS